VTEKEFISRYINKHTEINNKIFPDGFANLTETEKLEIPNKTLVLGSEFFGSVEILTTEGTPVLQAESIHKAKYIVYANLNRSGNIIIPKKENEIKTAVENYEKHLDWILLDIEEQLKKKLPESRNLHSVTNEIFLKLNLVRY
jgi:uncharacterized protein related to proFAR isomerase